MKKLKYDPNNLRDHIEETIKIGLKSALLSPGDRADQFMSFIVDDILVVCYRMDMQKYGGRNLYRRRLK